MASRIGLSMFTVVIWSLCTGLVMSEVCTDSSSFSETCQAGASRGSLLVQTWQERSERVITESDVGDGAFCCMHASDQNDVCGTCREPRSGNTYCGVSQQNCKTCGNHFAWCSGTSPEAPSPSPPSTKVGGDGFCCFWASDDSDTCGSCSNRAMNTHWCGASEERCKACGTHHTWCSGDPDGEGTMTSPTASPTMPQPVSTTTRNPTTLSPTVEPTVVPSNLPTVKPTAATTVAPTLVPTPTPPSPTEEPTVVPTAVPTVPPTAFPTVAPTPVPSPTPTQDTTGDSSGESGWTGHNMKMTHYWDCSGQGCDAATLQPWNMEKFISPPGYAPQDPADFGGSIYGEKMWLTGAASDALSELLGADDVCCGSDPNDGGVGGCGKCVLVQNPQSLHPDWTAVMMKKNRCPPWSNGCAAGEPHFDVAAPGFDNLQWSTANVCGERANTGFETKTQSAALGSWYQSCANTAECSDLCDQLPSTFQKGCKLFASWGWTRGDPDQVKFKAVECPANFVTHVGSLFGVNGATSL